MPRTTTTTPPTTTTTTPTTTPTTTTTTTTSSGSKASTTYKTKLSPIVTMDPAKKRDLIDFFECRRRGGAKPPEFQYRNNRARTNRDSDCSISCDAEKPSMETESGVTVTLIFY